MGVDGPLRPPSSETAGSTDFHPARRASLRERADSSRHGAEQDPEGFRGEVAFHGGVRLAVRARIRLPRPPDRAESRPRARPEEARDQPRGLPARLPRVRGAFHRRDDAGIPAARDLRRLGPSVPDDELPVSGRHCARAGIVCRAGPGLQGQEAGALVHPLPHGPGRSRSRVPGPLVTVHLRRVSARHGERRRDRPSYPGAGRTRRVGPHLDDDAVDDPVEPGDRLPSGF